MDVSGVYMSRSRTRFELPCYTLESRNEGIFDLSKSAPFRGKGDIVPITRRDKNERDSFTFKYQSDTYLYNPQDNTFAPISYPSDSKPPLSTFNTPNKGAKTIGIASQDVEKLTTLYGKNEFDIPIPSFSALFAEHAVAPFFVFQLFCVALWCLDEYWYYSIFTLFMLVMFECTVVWQRLRTLREFRTMSVVPYDIQVYRSGKWSTCRTDELIPGDIVSIARPSADQSIPADLLLLQGTVIVNEAMLSGESTPLLKESIELQDPNTKLSIDDGGIHKNCVLFSGTKPLQVTAASAIAQSNGSAEPSRAATPLKSALPTTPDGGALCAVLRTSFGTSQGQLVRTMIFSTDRVSANNLESFLFIGFLLIFAIAASAYVWIMGIERGLKKSKLLLDCVLIITSVVPPELPMELSLAVNTSLAALSKFAIFCTEPFRIPYAGRVDVCCFDKTGTITAESLVLEGVAGVNPQNPREMIDVKSVNPQTMHVLATAHALVKLDEDIVNSDTKAKKSGDNTIVGDPMEKTTLEALGWQLKSSDIVEPSHGRTPDGKSPFNLVIRRRFQFSSALKRMSTVSSVGKAGKCVASVKGAPETIKAFLTPGTVPHWYDETYKWYTRRGSRVLALAWKDLGSLGSDKINHLQRDEVESNLIFAGFLIFHCPLKPDAVETLKMLADSSHRCVMITGDNPLTAVHVAKEVEIVDRDALILDLRENPAHEGDLVWRSVDDKIVIPVDPSQPINTKLFNEYDICVTGAALRQYEGVYPASYEILVQNTWVYARVSPSQKEAILTTLKSLGYVTLMAGDGTNDVGALKQAHIGVALLDGTIEDLQKIADHARIERIKGVYETQLKFSQRFNQPPPPVPPMLAAHYPELVTAQERAKADQTVARKRNPLEKFDMASITDKLADMEDENEPPKIKLGDASCAAPFTSKLSNVAAISNIIRQGRCTLVATVQMYKILALNCLITAYSLSVQYLDGIKFGDYQVTITGMLMSPIEQLSRERPLGNIFNFYVLLSVLFQFAIHIAALLYITNLSYIFEPREGPIDLEAKFEPSLLNTAIYLLGLSQQVSTFAINFQGRPFREGITENSALYWGLVGAAGVAFSGATDFIPELNRPLQIVEMATPFKVKLTSVMIADFIGCWLVEVICKKLFADLAPKSIVTRGRERREARRAAELKERLEKERIEQEKKEAETLLEMEKELAKNESRKNR
ncbi:putative calcium-transporting ATPase [Serendipita vermifera]|nr:putative calcium-transporting ATPase [Serendipita vermifera]